MNTKSSYSAPSGRGVHEVIDFWQEGMGRLPPFLKKRVRDALAQLKAMAIDTRSPRILIMGRRGAGKSSLINAIFQQPVAPVGAVLACSGEAQWHAYDSPAGRLELLDTRGLGDRTRPSSARFELAEDEIRAAFEKQVPDAILFLCKAKEVDARIEDDVASTLEIQNHLWTHFDLKPPILGVLTQVDELDPKRFGPPYEHPEKRRHIRRARQALADAFSDQESRLARVFPTSAYAEYDGEVLVDGNAWNIDELVAYLVEVLPHDAQLMMARAARVQAVQRRLAQDVVKSATALCAGIAATPIPVADAIPLTAAQMAMISGVGFVAGRDLSKKTAAEFASAMGVNVGAAMVAREVARGLAKLIPAAGPWISSAVAGSATWALGQAAILYFLDGQSREQARAAMHELRRNRSGAEIEADIQEPGDGARP
ncbi:MAG: GTPase [Acidobacteriota bacterium]